MGSAVDELPNSSDNPELYQDIISQFPVLNGYTHILVGFETAANASQYEIVDTLQKAHDRIVELVPWLGWQAAKEDGIMKPMPWPEDVPRKSVRVKAAEKATDSMAQIIRKGAPLEMLETSVFTPWPGIPQPHGITGPLPIVALQVNFVQGGVVVSMSAHHNIMDGSGIVQYSRMLAAILEGQEVPAAEVEQANRDRKSVVPLIPAGEPVKDHPHLRRPRDFQFRPPASPAAWCLFKLPKAGLARLVKSVSEDASAGPVSENDILCGFYWQRVSTVRLANGAQFNTVAKFTRAIDGRIALGISPSYMGHMVCHAITHLPIGRTASMPVAQIAQALRRDMVSANTPWAIRSYATIMAREPDRSTLMYAGAQNPDVDVASTSWVISSDRSKGHALGSWGPLLGPVRFIRPARGAPLPGLFSPLPPEGGVTPILVCLPSKDLEGLKKDSVWSQYMKLSK